MLTSNKCKVVDKPLALRGWVNFIYCNYITEKNVY